MIVPYLRGYGPTRFLSADTLRSGEQAVLGHDLLMLMDALQISRAVVGGYDWGGRAACIVSALWPARVVALVSGNSYNIQDIARSSEPASAEHEASYWYQYYFHAERGRRGLTRNRREIAKLLWKMWSPTWKFDAATFEQSADAFDNPDFVDVVIHSYRHRYGLVAGDAAVLHIEALLAAQPDIAVPAIAIDGDRMAWAAALKMTCANLPVRMNTGYSKMPGTTCRRKNRRIGPGLCLTRVRLVDSHAMARPEV